MITPNYVWVDYPKDRKEEVKVGGICLFQDNTYRPEWHLILHGTVVSVPERFHYPVQEKIRVGDKIYFHYLVPGAENQHDKKLRVPIEQVFCYVRDGQITMVGGHVLAKAVWDEDIQDVDVDGKTIKARVSDSGLVTSVNVDYRKNLSKVYHIGLPLKNSPELDCKAGDEVFMKKFSQQKYEIEGEEYFVFTQKELLCVIA